MNSKEYYLKRKNQAEQEAIDWQCDFGNHTYYWSDIAYFADYFYKLGKRYGLLKVFKANGII